MPPPFTVGVGVFTFQGKGEINRAVALGQVVAVQTPSAPKKPIPTGSNASYSFTTNATPKEYDIRTIQELLGHKNIEPTMIYTHVLNRGGLAVRSPLDN